MSNYSKATNFTAKDALATGNPSKIIKGSEFDTEFDAISTSIATKLDSTGSAATLTALPAAEGGSLALLYTLTPSAVATIEFTTASHPNIFNGTYSEIIFELNAIKPATDDVYLVCRVGTGGGPTYQASGYDWGLSVIGVGGTASDGSSTSGVASSMVLSRTGAAQGIGNGTGEHISGTMKMWNLNGSNFPIYTWKGSYVRSDGAGQGADGFGRYGSAGAITAFRWLFSSGNITSGTIKAYGVK